MIGLQTVNSDGSGPNLVLKQDGNVGIGYKSTASNGFPQSPLHIETAGGNQLILGGGTASDTQVRLFMSSPVSSNNYLIMGVGSGNNATEVKSAASIYNGFRLLTDSTTGTLTLNWTTTATTPDTPAVTFTRSNGSTLFSGDVYIDSNKYFRMYNGAQNLGITYASFEIDASNGATRIGKDTTRNTTAGSLVLGSHLILNDVSVPTTATRPATGTRGLIRFNDDNKSAEIYDGSYWVDVGYYAGTPLGAIIAYPSDIAPSAAFKLCNGETLSKTGVYADLFTIISYAYSATKSGDTFQLPDIQGRTIVGFNDSDTTTDPFKPLGATGGQKRVALSKDEMPAHTHPVPETSVSGTVSSSFTGTAARTKEDMIKSEADRGATGKFGHYHQTNVLTGSEYQATYESRGMTFSGWNQFSDRKTKEQDAGQYHTHEFTAAGTVSSSFSSGTTIETTTGSTGSSLSHNNLQPYIVLNYFIKVVRDSKRYDSTSAVASDIRVKRNVVSLNADQAIESIRGLQPKRYEYIDRNISEFAQHIGFIAQEVKLCIPESVRTKKEYIPNIYSMAKLTSSGSPGNALLTSVQHPIAKLIKDQLLLNMDSDTNISINGIKLKMFNKSKECFYVCCVESIDDYNIIVEPLDAVTTTKILSADYFVYGQEIEDYHYMNNDAVFSTLVSAFQALDKTCKSQQLLITRLIEKNNLKL
jgi:microcystin-dependent protein